MNTQLLDELSLKIDKINHKLELLLQKGSNDENLVSKKRQLLKEYLTLKQQLKHEGIL